MTGVGHREAVQGPIGQSIPRRVSRIWTFTSVRSSLTQVLISSVLAPRLSQGASCP